MTSGRSRTRRLTVYAARAVLCYALFVGFWAIWRVVAPDSSWVLVLLDKLAMWFLLPAPIVALLAALTRRRRAIVAATVPLVVLLAFTWPAIVPREVPEIASRELRVLTWNLWNGNRDVERMARTLRASSADVVALQEVMPEVWPELLTELGTDWPHRHLSERSYGGTTALLSMHGFAEIESLDLGTDRPAILARIEMGTYSLSVVSAHLYPS